MASEEKPKQYVKINDKDRRVLKYIHHYWDRHSFTPSFREICRHFNHRSPASAYKRVKRLVNAGLLKKSIKRGGIYFIADLRRALGEIEKVCD